MIHMTKKATLRRFVCHFITAEITYVPIPRERNLKSVSLACGYKDSHSDAIKSLVFTPFPLKVACSGLSLIVEDCTDM